MKISKYEVVRIYNLKYGDEEPNLLISADFSPLVDIPLKKDLEIFHFDEKIIEIATRKLKSMKINQEDVQSSIFAIWKLLDGEYSCEGIVFGLGDCNQKPFIDCAEYDMRVISYVVGQCNGLNFREPLDI